MQLTFLCLVFVTAYAATALPVEHRGPVYIDIPNGMQKVDLQAEPDLKLLEEVNRNPASNMYLLFTRRNPRNPQTLVMNNAASILNSNFNPRVTTVVVVHGFLGSQHVDMNPTIKNACINDRDVNVIVMDWSRLAMSSYVTAVSGVPAVGRGLGQFLNFLNQIINAPFHQLHLIGFDLGAHIVGNAGREIGGRAARVTGLSPAGPLWDANSDRLNRNDGLYVEGIHTDGGLGGMGIGTNVGNADFFVNGGISQPGCLMSTCNHDRAWQLFAATVTFNHLLGFDHTTGETLPMGNNILPKWGNGTFRVTTRAQYPF